MTLLLAFSKMSFGQESTLEASLDYALVPTTSAGVSAQLFDLNIGVPVSLGAVALKPVIGLHNYDIEYWEDLSFNTQPVENIHNVFAGVEAEYQWNQDVSVMARINVSWASGIRSDQTVVTGATAFQYKFKKSSPTTLRLGIQYGAALGDLQLLPLAELAFSTKRFHMTLGFPETRIKYALNTNSSIETSFSFNGDYFYLPKTTVLDTHTATQASIANQKLGLDYTYTIDDSWAFSLNGGYLFKNELNLYQSLNNTVYTLDMGTGPVFSTGIKFNFSK